jgi:hypothetical protein
MFDCFEPILYLDQVSKFPETPENPGYFVVFADNEGESSTFKILKYDLTKVLHTSVTRSAAEPNQLSKRVKLKPDVQ